jgi:hypothetical protein
MDVVAVVEQPQNIGFNLLPGNVFEFKKNRSGAFAGIGNVKMVLFFVFLLIQIKLVNEFF